MRNLNSQKSLGNDQYPKTVVDACQMLSNHKSDNANKINKKKEHKGKGNRNQKNDSLNTKEDDSAVLSFAQLEGQCYCCGKRGHKLPDCNKKDKFPKPEWAINKSQQQFAQEQKTQTNSSSAASSNNSVRTEPRSEPTVGWAGLHHSLARVNPLML